MDFSRLSRNPSIFSRLMVEYKKDFAGWGERAPALSLAAPVCRPQGEREPAGSICGKRASIRTPPEADG